MNTTKYMTLGSLFDGIGGFPYAGLFYGIEPLWASEILPQAVSVTKRHFPNMAHVGDITKLNGGELPPVDIITFGSPCQDLSTAGKRAGIAGERSSLFYEAIRIIDEMREATHGEYPKYAIWENVPGALSSGHPRGSDFRTVLEAFTKAEIPVPQSGCWANAGMVRSDGVNLAWRILNSQYFGVPQRRRRIFLVASFGAGCPGEILFVEEGMRGHFAAGGEAEQGITSDVEGGIGGSVRGNGCLTPWDVQSRRVHAAESAWPALYSKDGGGHGYTAVNCLNPLEKQQSSVFTEGCESPTLEVADGGGERNPAGLVFAAFLGGASAKARSIGYSEEVSPTLKSVACGFSSPCVCEPGVARTLTARGDGSPNIDGGPNIIATEIPAVTMRLREGCNGGGKGPLLQEEISGTLATGNDQYLFTQNAVGVHQNQSGQRYPAVLEEHPLLCVASTQSDAAISETICHTITAAAGTSGNNRPYIVHPDISGTLCASGAGLSRPAGMASEPDLCVAYALQGNMIGRQHRNGPNGSGVSENISYTLTATDTHAVATREPIPIHDKATRWQNGGLTRNGDGAGNGLGVGKAGDPAPTMTAGDHHAVAAFIRGRSDKFSPGDVASTQAARQSKEATNLISQPVAAVDCRNFYETNELSGTLQAKETGGYSLNCQNPVRSGYIVRRLTPTECERLQGFPDGWTRYGHDGAEISDTRRYQMLGNSVAVPCVAFVLNGIAAQLNVSKRQG